jgi:GT2 family glycosyltransferase
VDRQLALSERPAVDVGVVTWNTRDLTVSALRKLLDTDQGVDITLYVRDNGSTDGTPDAITQRVPEAKLEVGANVGFGAGMNTLIARSSSPWFFCLNSDAWPEPGAIATLVAAAEAHPRAAAIAPRLEAPDGELEFSTHPFPSPGVAAVVNLGLHRLLSEHRKADMLLDGWWRHDVSRPVDWAVGAALLMRRSALREIGGFDERFFMYAEDLEWGWRAHARGYETWFEPSALVRHVGNASGAQMYDTARTIAYLRNTHRFYAQTHGTVSSLAYRALEAAGSAGQWLRHRHRGERHEAGAWKQRTMVHLRPVTGADGPPSNRPDGGPAPTAH